MKKLFYASLLISLASVSAFAQVAVDCSSARYDQEVFQQVNISSSVVYGSNYSQSGSLQSLDMDIYEPVGDTLQQRPLIVWAHGGSFVGGTKNDPDITELATRFAKRGYVCASINYRIGVSFPPNQTSTTQAVFRATQDMKAAIRFFRKDAATSNLYRIDPTTIFAGGSSAGAFMALHLAYLDDPSELPSQIDTTVLGGLEGNSGNPGYSSEVKAIVNLCGALGNKTWMHPGDEPVCSMHGTNDGTVPYATAVINFLGLVPIMTVDGSYSVNQYADQIGVPNVMYTYYGADHVPYLASTAYMDTTAKFVSNFLFTRLGCTPPDPTPYPNTFNGPAGIAEAAVRTLEVFPQPVTDRCIVRSSDLIRHLEVVDLSGRQVLTSDPYSREIQLDFQSVSTGTYLMRIECESGVFFRKLIVE